jgi:hypothetical protein
MAIVPPAGTSSALAVIDGVKSSKSCPKGLHLGAWGSSAQMHASRTASHARSPPTHGSLTLRPGATDPVAPRLQAITRPIATSSHGFITRLSIRISASGRRLASADLQTPARLELFPGRIREAGDTRRLDAPTMFSSPRLPNHNLVCEGFWWPRVSGARLKPISMRTNEGPSLQRYRDGERRHCVPHELFCHAIVLRVREYQVSSLASCLCEHAMAALDVDGEHRTSRANFDNRRRGARPVTELEVALRASQSARRAPSTLRGSVPSPSRFSASDARSQSDQSDSSAPPSSRGSNASFVARRSSTSDSRSSVSPRNGAMNANVMQHPAHCSSSLVVDSTGRAVLSARS